MSVLLRRLNWHWPHNWRTLLAGLPPVLLAAIQGTNSPHMQFALAASCLMIGALAKDAGNRAPATATAATPLMPYGPGTTAHEAWKSAVSQGFVKPLPQSMLPIWVSTTAAGQPGKEQNNMSWLSQSVSTLLSAFEKPAEVGFLELLGAQAIAHETNPAIQASIASAVSALAQHITDPTNAPNYSAEVQSAATTALATVVANVAPTPTP